MIARRNPQNISSSSCQIADLNHDQQQRLTDVLDDYLKGLEEGEPVDVQKVLRQNADIADTLRDYLATLNSLRGIAPGFQSHGDLEPLVSGDSGDSVHSLQLGEYTIIGEVGRGGMGIVYEAQHDALNRRVALKILPIASMLDSRQIARFKNESNAAAQLQHPHIVPIYSVGMERGIHYYAMQFIEGENIESAIATANESGQQDHYRQVLSRVAEVADALHCAHQCGIIHRDIKPSNLILDKSGKIWVTDFGLARCQNQNSLTLSGDVVGTMRYMSPEQAAGQMERVDHRADIYSLGATLYEMLTGLPAITGEDSPAVLSEIANCPVPKPRRLKPDLPPAIDFVVQKAMAKNKDDRYCTALEFANDLEAVLDQKPTLARPPSRTWLLKQWTSRHRRLVLSTSVMLLFGIAAMLTALVVIANKNGELQASKQAADRNFQKAQEAVGTLGLAVSADLASIPGTEHIRQSVLENTLKHYKDFVQESEGNRTLLSELALTHSRIGSLILELESPEAAIPHFAASENSYRALLSENPGSVEALQGRARNLNQMGLAQTASGDHQGARRCYDHAIRIQQDLTEHTSVVEHQIDLALSRSNLGLLMVAADNASEAEIILHQSVNSLSKLTQTHPNHVLANRGLAAALTNLSSLTLDTAPDQAIVLLEAAIDCQLRIRKSAPSQLKSSSEIANTYNALGAAELSAENASEAIDAFALAIEINRKMHAIAPSVSNYRDDLATSLNNIANAYYQQQQYASATQAAREAINLQLTSLKRNPANADSLKRLAIMHGNLAAALAAMELTATAIQAYQHAIDFQTQVLEVDPTDTASQISLMQLYSALLRYQIQQQHWNEANRTLTAYRLAAEDRPEHIIPAATSIAEISKSFDGHRHQELFTANIAALFATAKQRGININPAILETEVFANFSEDNQIRRAVRK